MSDIESETLEGGLNSLVGAKFKTTLNIKTSDRGKKYIVVKGKKLYLKTLLKRINKKRIKEGKKPYKNITKRNLENTLIQLLFKKTDIGKEKLGKTTSLKRQRGLRPSAASKRVARQEAVQQATLDVLQELKKPSKVQFFDEEENKKRFDEIRKNFFPIGFESKKFDENVELNEKFKKEIFRRFKNEVDNSLTNFIQKGKTISLNDRDNILLSVKNFLETNEIAKSLMNPSVSDVVNNKPFKAPQAEFRLLKGQFFDLPQIKTFDLNKEQRDRLGKDIKFLITELYKSNLQNNNVLFEEADESYRDANIDLSDEARKKIQEGILAEIVDNTPETPPPEVKEFKQLKEVKTKEPKPPEKRKRGRPRKVKEIKKVKETKKVSVNKIKEEENKVVKQNNKENQKIKFEKDKLNKKLDELDKKWNRVLEIGDDDEIAKLMREKEELNDKIKSLENKQENNVVENKATEEFVDDILIKEELETQREQRGSKLKPKDNNEELREQFGVGILLQNGGLLNEPEQKLSNFDIEKHMDRYDNFYGVYAKDMLYKVIPLIQPGSRGGVIMNLDDNGEPGSHWVSIYWDANKDYSIEYFDSFGREPPKETLEDITKIIKKLKPNKHMKLKINRIENQDKSSVSCGFIAMRFLMDRFRGKNFKKATGYGIKKSEDMAEKMYERFNYIE